MSFQSNNSSHANATRQPRVIRTARSTARIAARADARRWREGPHSTGWPLVAGFVGYIGAIAVAGALFAATAGVIAF